MSRLTVYVPDNGRDEVLDLLSQLGVRYVIEDDEPIDVEAISTDDIYRSLCGRSAQDVIDTAAQFDITVGFTQAHKVLDLLDECSYEQTEPESLIELVHKVLRETH